MKQAFSILALVLVLALPARADDTADEAEFRFRHAAELYSKGKFDEALGEFFASNRLARNKNVIYNIARCFEQIGQWNEAFRFYNDLLAEKWSADERAGLEAAIDKIKPKLALVRVETDPPGADVYVDRKDLGSRGLSPRVMALPTGPATVIVELAGYRAASQAVTLEKGREIKVLLPLDRIFAHVRAASDPAGAEVRVDAASDVACVAPCDVKVLPGRHVLHFALAGHVATKGDVEVGPDSTTALEVKLPPVPPPTGKLVVTANKDGALVTVDGVESGFTPAVLDSVIAGKHGVSVSFEDYETWTGEVVVEADRSATVRARLSVPAPQVSAASKALTSSAEAPASVTVITAEEIRAFRYRTLGDALKAVRGLYLTNDGIYDEVGIRGFQPPGDVNTRLLVLLDGHTMNDAWTGQSNVGFDLDVDLSQVERIEVVRGPASALYGSSAVFGVVNVVSRAAPRTGNVEVLAGGGNNGTIRGRVSGGFGGKDGEPALLVTAAALQADGRDSQVLPAATPRVVTGGDGEEARHFAAHARAGDVTFHGSYNVRPKNTRMGVWGTAVGEDTKATDERAFAELRWEKELGSTTLTARAYADYLRYMAHNVYEAETGGGLDPTRELDGANWAGAELRARTSLLGGAHVLSLGGEFQPFFKVFQHIRQESTGEDQLNDERTMNVVNGFLADDWRLGERVFLQAALGLRAAQGAVAGTTATAEWNVNPRLALVARPYDGGLSKLLFGKAFRAPSIYERYYEDGGISQIPALNLQPETIYTLEGEHSHRVSDDVVATGAVFANRLSSVVNLIYVPKPGGVDGEQVVQFTNATDAETQWAFGAEAEVRWQPTRLTLVSFAYSFQYSRSPLTGTALENSPAHLASLRAMAPIVPGVTVAGEATYGSARVTSDGQRVGEALLVNLAVTGDLPKLGLQYGVATFNLLNEQYAYPQSSSSAYQAVPQLGRLVQVTLGKSF